MMPLNELAKKAYDQYMDKLDEGHKAFCAKQEPPIPFVPHARIYEHQKTKSRMSPIARASPWATRPPTK